MNNHVHLIWQARDGHILQKIQQFFLKYNAQQIKFDLLVNKNSLLDDYKINADDRKYNFWERRSLGIELFTTKAYQQKPGYIHNNPVKGGLCKYPAQYHYSSARFYHSGKDEFDMLTY
ncbi:hypothetical protein BH11BAC4_BH11BAC4_08790 [soil metagenome]